MSDMSTVTNGTTEQDAHEPLRAVEGEVMSQSTALAAPEPAPLVERKRAALDVAALTPGDLLQPRSMEELWRVAVMFHQSGMYKGRFSAPQQIAAVMMEAAERGIGVATALKHAYVVNGNVGWSALFVAGQVRTSAKCEYFEVNTSLSTAERCVIDYKVRGRPAQQYVLTANEAQAFGKSNPLWKSAPRLMLERRAVMWAARAAFPEVAAGIQSEDELIDLAETAPPAPEQPAHLPPAAAAAASAREALTSRPPVSQAPAAPQGGGKAPPQARGGNGGRKPAPADRRAQIAEQARVSVGIVELVERYQAEPLDVIGRAVRADGFADVTDADVGRVLELLRA